MGQYCSSSPDSPLYGCCPVLELSTRLQLPSVRGPLRLARPRQALSQGSLRPSRCPPLPAGHLGRLRGHSLPASLLILEMTLIQGRGPWHLVAVRWGRRTGPRAAAPAIFAPPEGAPPGNIAGYLRHPDRRRPAVPRAASRGPCTELLSGRGPRSRRHRQ